MRCKHYYYFGKKTGSIFKADELGNKLDKKKWDILRVSSDISSFAIEDTQEEYERNCMLSTEYVEMAQVIASKINKDARIVSIGIGKGILEWNIKKIYPSIVMDCADYTKKSLEKLSKVWTNHDNLFVFDMIRDEWSSMSGYDEVILCRLSTEFDRDTWKKIFQYMYESGIEKVVFIPTEIADIRHMIKESMKHIINRCVGRKDTFCGWLNDYSEMLRFFEKFYDIVEEIRYKENNSVFFLQRK